MDEMTGRYHRVVDYRIVREALAPAHQASCANERQAAAIALDVIPDDGREHLILVGLDAQRRVMLVHHVSTGSATSTIVHPREVFGPAVREGIVSIIIAHNHPSGAVAPSREDIGLAMQLAASGVLLAVMLDDFIIVSHANREALWSAASSGVVGKKTTTGIKSMMGRIAAAMVRKHYVVKEG